MIYLLLTKALPSLLRFDFINKRAKQEWVEKTSAKAQLASDPNLQRARLALKLWPADGKAGPLREEQDPPIAVRKQVTLRTAPPIISVFQGPNYQVDGSQGTYVDANSQTVSGTIQTTPQSTAQQTEARVAAFLAHANKTTAREPNPALSIIGRNLTPSLDLTPAVTMVFPPIQPEADEAKEITAQPTPAPQLDQRERNIVAILSEVRTQWQGFIKGAGKTKTNEPFLSFVRGCLRHVGLVAQSRDLLKLSPATIIDTILPQLIMDYRFMDHPITRDLEQLSALLDTAISEEEKTPSAKKPLPAPAKTRPLTKEQVSRDRQKKAWLQLAQDTWLTFVASASHKEASARNRAILSQSRSLLASKQEPAEVDPQTIDLTKVDTEETLLGEILPQLQKVRAFGEHPVVKELIKVKQHLYELDSNPGLPTQEEIDDHLARRMAELQYRAAG